ncbi:DUF3298 domain-containing protein [Mucilaginibacter terrenus]|uniref:DUF3298 domain-containing protein n=1 Tax=Mucilaginibacter terrenus TaxID=2482727 RepID=A0A3E2NV43_9SPHI|nr:RsiV family protein [Mucilaginibacter terrenus]RFZ84884.1 DUF3298 domain-containing protein [Mucilaginibacter terrenus]
MRILFWVCTLLIVFSSCQFGTERRRDRPDIFKDTLTYTYKTIHERATDCGNKADSACTVVNVKYPFFKNAPLLNDTIEAKGAKMFMVGENAATSLHALTKNFLQLYMNDVAPKNKSNVIYRLDINVNLVQQDSALLALQLTGSIFQGGAHGGTYIGFINWNPKTKSEILLKDILVDGYQDKLTHVADSIFRKDEKLKDTSSLARDYFFKDDRFALNNNFSLTPVGIRFMYNEYEIKPYAAGQTELLIPYDKIKELIIPKSVIARYIKNDVGI